jgi:Bacterial PH domain
VEKPQTFRSPTAVVIWVVWLLFAVGNWIDLAVQGRDHLSVVAAAVLLLATGMAYVTAQRPRIIADNTGVTIRNPLRDYRIGWAGVVKIDLLDLLRVHCAWGPGGSGGEGSPPGSGGSTGVAPQESQHHKVISAWAVHYSRQRQFVADTKARRTARRSAAAMPMGFGRSYEPVAAREPASGAEADAKKVVRLLSDRATAARAEAVWASGTAEIPGAQATGTAAATQPAETGTGIAAREPRLAESRAATGTEPAGATAIAAADWAEPLTSTWSRRALAALVIPALILLVVCLV